MVRNLKYILDNSSEEQNKETVFIKYKKNIYLFLYVLPKTSLFSYFLDLWNFVTF